MKTETLRLSGTLDESVAMEIARVLNTLKGVSKIAITTATGAIDVAYDENITSMQELRAVLQKTGFGTKRLEHGDEGMCCGSCGG